MTPWDYTRGEMTQNFSKLTRLYPEMCLHGVNTQWVYSQAVIQKPLERWKPKGGYKHQEVVGGHLCSKRQGKRMVGKRRATRFYGDPPLEMESQTGSARSSLTFGSTNLARKVYIDRTLIPRQPVYNPINMANKGFGHCSNEDAMAYACGETCGVPCG